MNRSICAFFFVICTVVTVFAQDREMQRAFENGRPVPTTLRVFGNVSAQAVLIPRVDARRIFGSEIANNYAVIEINVGNKTPDAVLIIHGIFIDYSRWALSGNSFQGTSSLDGITRETVEPFEASTKPNQIASEEYRVVRGQLLDAQMWTKRNWTMRILTFAGSLASAYSFSIGEEGIVRGLNAFSGVAVPGFREVWPDGTIEQLNRISDFGYQTNKVIPKQAAEVIVCFFPIDRFLTPGFKKLFLKSPALFFAPLQMLVDPALRKDANRVLAGLSPTGDTKVTVETLRPLLPCYLQITNALRYERNRVVEGKIQDRNKEGKIQDMTSGCQGKFGLESVSDKDHPKALFKVSHADKFEQLLALDFISQMSLNSVSVTVDGVMTLETVNIPAQLNAVTFDTIVNCAPDQACYWTDVTLNDGVRTGTIEGAYLTGGTVDIAETSKADFGIQEVTTIGEGSTDQRLRFSFKLKSGIEPTTLHFTVGKPKQGSTTSPPERVISMERLVPIGFTLNGPQIERAERKGTSTEIVVTGKNFNATPERPLTVTVLDKDGKEVPQDGSPVIRSEKISIKITGDPKPADCFKVVVTVRDFPNAEKSTCP
jgi:hypothetical protein